MHTKLPFLLSELLYTLSRPFNRRLDYVSTLHLPTIDNKNPENYPEAGLCFDINGLALSGDAVGILVKPDAQGSEIAYSF